MLIRKRKWAETMPSMQHVLDLIDRDRTQAIEFLQSLIRIPTDNPPGYCTPAAEAIVARLKMLGFQPELHEVAGTLVAANGMTCAANVIVRHRFGDGPTIALNAHGDAVPPGAGWTEDPYGGAIVEGWVYGRGAAVSKSDIAAQVFALRALIESGIPLSGAVELHITFDEEVGGRIGPELILSSGLSRPDYAICPAFSYSVVTAHNGCLHVEVRLKGRSAHAAWPRSGRDALEAATRILTALYAYRDGLESRRSTTPGLTHPTLVVGLINGGINTNVVPDAVTFRIDRRVLPEEDIGAAESDLYRVIRHAAGASPGITVEIETVLSAKPFVPLPGSERLAEIVTRHASRETGEVVRTEASPLYTDARHYAEAGIPTVMYGAGPRNPLEARGHRADERVPAVTITIAAKVLAATIIEMLEPSSP